MKADLALRLDSLYADEHLIAVDKPAGLLSVPGRGEDKADCALARVRLTYPEALSAHRLDMATSGLLLLARSTPVHRALSILFERREISKIYIADVDGVPEPATGLIDLPLIADWPNRPRQKIDHDTGKPSQTRYRTQSSTGAVTRLDLEPLTGRSHQLRVHLAAMGHPILGDEFYAPEPVRAAKPRLHLHAARLSFVHPVTCQRLVLESPCPF